MRSCRLDRKTFSVRNIVGSCKLISSGFSQDSLNEIGGFKRVKKKDLLRFRITNYFGFGEMQLGELTIV